MRTVQKYFSLSAFVFFLVVLSFLSCKKFVEPPMSPGLIETSDVFSTDKGALSAVTGLYSQMRLATFMLSNGGMSIYTSLSSDDIINTATNATADPFRLNQLLPSNRTVGANFWSHAYTNIYHANAILEGLSKSTQLTDSVKVQLSGEMKVVRAFYYFYLVNLFGPVPLVVNTDYEANAVTGRTDTAQVYQQIIQDLLEAQMALKVGYPSSQRARPNKWTATALLARVYLYLKSWPEAEAQSQLVINSGQYGLVTSLASVFANNSNETIWQLVSETSNTAEGANFIPSSATVKPTYALTAGLVSAFEPTDQRKTSWTGLNTVSTVPYYYPNKYKVRASTPVSEANIVLRLAELVLISAEAKAHQGNISGAKTDLNKIRSRASLPGSTATTEADILAAIEKERRIELFCEWGHRWLDLKRTGRADAVLAPVKGATWQATDVLFPIPQDQINLNSKLTQNLGY